MSRSRERKRERRREVERQLDGADAPEDLQARARVTRVDVVPERWVIERAPKKLLGRLPAPRLGLAVALKDPAGLRWVYQGVVDGGQPERAGLDVEGPGVTGGPRSVGDDGRLRYSRPAHFVLLAWRVDGDGGLGAPDSVRFGPAGSAERCTLDDKALLSTSWETVRPIVLEGVAGPAVAVVLRGVHRVKDVLELPLEDDERRWVLHLALEL